MSRVGILGAGGMAREAARYSFMPVDFYAVSQDFIDDSNELLIDIEHPSEQQRLTKVVAAIGSPAVRRAMIDAWPGREYTNIIAASAELYTDQVGKDVIIAPKAIVTTDTCLGDHVIVNISATISHDCELGDYVTVSPGAHIAGGVKLGNGVFVGIGATISNGVEIADGVVIGAGAVVVSDIKVKNSVVVGSPARCVRVQEGWLNNV